MQIYVTGSTNPCYNLAVEEYLLKNSEDDCFLLWQNEPTVVIGKNQNLYAEVELEKTESQGIHVVRRITGGGAVYHDLGNVNYSYITSRDKANVLDFAFFSQPIVDALAEMGIKAGLSGRNDLLTEDGLKFSGNAQTATQTRILHHGTLLFDSDLQVLSSVLKPDPEKLKKRAIASVRSRVTNLRQLLPEPKMETQEFLETLLRFAENRWKTERQLFETVDSVFEAIVIRNGSEDYIAGRKESYENKVAVHFPGGMICFLYSLSEGKVCQCSFEGDFFGEEPIERLAEMLCGQPFEKEAFLGRLAEAQLELFVKDLSAEVFVNELFGR